MDVTVFFYLLVNYKRKLIILYCWKYDAIKVLCKSQGDTPLIMATRIGMIDIVKQLLAHGADSSIADKVNNQFSHKYTYTNTYESKL